MRRTRAILAAVLCLAVGDIGLVADTRTADGVAAFLRRDYGRAAELLVPAANDPWQQDAVANFFLGVMYDGGLGVAADPVRACALYTVAMSAGGPQAINTPIGAAAMALMRPKQRSLGTEFELCAWQANHGFDHQFDPVTFTLGPGHWIAWDIRGATITYNGSETRTPLPLATRFGRFLPLRHVELAMPDESRRHFIELFKWAPAAQPKQWTLMWAVFEVVADRLIPVVTEYPLTATGAAPPALTAGDLDAMVGVAANGKGEAEWTVLTGAVAKRGVIPSDAERQAAEAEGRKRAAAEARVDWRKRRDPARTPSLVYDADKSQGCGNIFVVGWTDDRTEAITVRANREILQGASTGTVDLAISNTVDVRLHVFAGAMGQSTFCSDVGMPGQVERTWRATRGAVTIELSAPGVDRRAPHLYRATVRIVNGRFVNAQGVTIDQQQPVAVTALVGSFS